MKKTLLRKIKATAVVTLSLVMPTTAFASPQMGVVISRNDDNLRILTPTNNEVYNISRDDLFVGDVVSLSIENLDTPSLDDDIVYEVESVGNINIVCHKDYSGFDWFGNRITYNNK